MSQTGSLTYAAKALQTTELERRLHSRYPITLRMEYRLFGAIGEWNGFGKTLNVSSGGILFEADSALPAYSPVELLIDWPVLLNGTCALKLLMRGLIVRADNRLIAATNKFHMFRTAGSGKQRMQNVILFPCWPDNTPAAARTQVSE